MLVTNNLKHDSCVADVLQAKSLEHLKSLGVKIKKKTIQLCANF